jgi:hypothetical protein
VILSAVGSLACPGGQQRWTGVDHSPFKSVAESEKDERVVTWAYSSTSGDGSDARFETGKVIKYSIHAKFDYENSLLTDVFPSWFFFNTYRQNRSIND